MKRYIYLPLLALLLAAGACHKSDKNISEGAPVIDVALPTVDSVILHKSYPGVMSANQEVDVVARVDGYLQSQNYNSGDFVRKGSVLFTLEDRNYRDAVAQAQAALATAKSTYAYASSRYEAMKKALAGDAVSEMEVAQAKSAMEEAEASIKNSTAALATAQTSLSYCTVRAPFDGHMTSNNFDIGAFIAGSVSPVKLARIYEDYRMVVEFNIEDSGYLGNIRDNYEKNPGLYDSIPISFSEPLAHKYTGDIYYFAPNIDKSTGTMNVKCFVDNPYNELRSGMYSTVDLPYGTDPKAILVKASALGSDQLGSYLYVVNDSNKVVYTPVKTGELVNDTLRIVTSGITPQSRYVTKALLKVRDGMTVEPRLTR